MRYLFSSLSSFPVTVYYDHVTLSSRQWVVEEKQRWCSGIKPSRFLWNLSEHRCIYTFICILANLERLKLIGCSDARIGCTVSRETGTSLRKIITKKSKTPCARWNLHQRPFAFTLSILLCSSSDASRFWCWFADAEPHTLQHVSWNLRVDACVITCFNVCRSLKQSRKAVDSLHYFILEAPIHVATCGDAGTITSDRFKSLQLPWQMLHSNKRGKRLKPIACSDVCIDATFNANENL